MNIPWNAIPLFSDLEDSLLKQIENLSIQLFFKKQTLIFSPGEKSDRLYILLNGTVKLFNKRKGTQKEETVCIIKQHGIFCLSPVINNEDIHIHARTVEDSEVLVIPREILMHCIDSSHEFSKRIIRFLARKECDLCQEVCDLSLSTTKERLAKYLLRSFEDAGSSPTFSLGLQQGDLASYLGTVRETVSRDLSDLKKAGVISLRRGIVTLLNEDELKNIAFDSNSSCSSMKILSE